MKINVGDYVRLPDGIHKIKHYEYRPDYENCHCMYLDDNDYGLLFTNKDLIKISPNIIDLIEIGDYVNGYRVIEFMLENGKRKGIIVDADIWWFDMDEIKSIVTKEQFESMEYRINE